MSNPSFVSFASQKGNRIYISIALIASIIQIVVFKLLYPYADFFSDSYAYIFTAIKHQGVGIWPIGYSKFIYIFHEITYSDTALVVFQYMFVEVMFLYFFITIRYFYQVSSRISNVLFLFLFLNPLYLYLCNYISSDGLFLGLSILWLADMLWLIHKPRPIHIITQGLIVLVAFTFRYNAMYYPLITALAFILSKQPVTFKIIGTLIPVLLITAFVTYTRNEALKLTGTKQFSVFSGWQLANNALYMYPHIKMDKQPPAALNEFHQMVEEYFKTVPEEIKYVSPREGAFYIKYYNAPLKKYLSARFDFSKDTTEGVAAWGSVAPMYGKYGRFLIAHNIIPFTRYFIFPNVINYFIPPLEKLEIYNLGEPEVSPIAQYWFQYPDTKVKAVSTTVQGWILFIFPILFMVINFLFLSSIIWILIRWLKYRRYNLKIPLALIVMLFLANAGFSILASPIVFRYQVFPMILCFTFSLLIIEKMEVSDEADNVSHL